MTIQENKISEFSVLMSIYNKEKSEYLVESLNSLLTQTCIPNEIVIVKDGPLTAELDKLLCEYEKNYPSLFVFVPLKQNVGLGLALAEGVLHCKYNLIARMDTDDIAVQNRFELQLKAFFDFPKLDICGGQISEFEDAPSHIITKRNVPLDNTAIIKYQKRRDAFNHVSVMFKKEAVIKAGNYQSVLLMEDTLLWVNMILTGANCMNLPDCLVLARIGKDMYERRGGLSYYRKYKAGRKKVKDAGFIGWYDYYLTLIIQFIVAMIPNTLRGFVFKKILHQ